jgi:2-dehydro-3-deoxyphosphogluconate aldolase/(4S)-4-hydroxy-2-oxoglutarate aldolase
MNKSDVLENIKELGLLAVIRGPSPSLTIEIVRALLAGGVKGIEITYSTPNAEEVVAELVRNYGNQILVGMGTLTDVEQVECAKKAGAKFLVSPIYDPSLIQAMLESDLLVMAGALTPTEVFQAYRLGSDVIKIFPGSLTGPAYIKTLHGPFPNIPFMPTGGVNINNIADWFGSGVIAVGAGSELCPPNLAIEGRFEEITKRAVEFLSAISNIRKAK